MATTTTSSWHARVLRLAIISSLTLAGCTADLIDEGADKSRVEGCAIEIISISATRSPCNGTYDCSDSYDLNTGLWAFDVQVDVPNYLVKEGYEPAIRYEQEDQEVRWLPDLDGARGDARDYEKVDGASSGYQRFQLELDFAYNDPNENPFTITPYLRKGNSEASAGSTHVFKLVDGDRGTLSDELKACDFVSGDSIEQVFAYEGDPVFIPDADRELGTEPSVLCDSGELPMSEAWIGEATMTVDVPERFNMTGSAWAKIGLWHHWHGDIRVDLIDPKGKVYKLHACENTSGRRGAYGWERLLGAEHLIPGQWTARVRDYWFDSSGAECGDPGLEDSERNCKNELQSFRMEVTQSID